MIRASDFNPKIKYPDNSLGLPEESEWKRNVCYLDQTASIFDDVSKWAGLMEELFQELSLKPVIPIAASVGQIVKPLTNVSPIVNFYISAEAFKEWVQEGKLEFNIPSLKEALLVTEKGIGLVAWFAAIEKLGFSFRVVSSLSSMGLGVALLSPMLDLLMHLREEGWNALCGLECYKTSYKLGLSLLAVYLFVSAVTLSIYLTLIIEGTTFALSYI